MSFILLCSKVNAMTFDAFLTYKTHWDAKKEREGKGQEAFGKDKSLPLRHFETGSDNCADKLHAIRLVNQ